MYHELLCASPTWIINCSLQTAFLNVNSTCHNIPLGGSGSSVTPVAPRPLGAPGGPQYGWGHIPHGAGASGGAGGSSEAGASGGAGANRAWAGRAAASSGAGGAGGSGGAEASGAVAELEPAEQGPAVAQVGAAELGAVTEQGPEVGQAMPVSESREGPPHPSQQQTDSQLLLL